MIANDRRSVLIELAPEYAELARERVSLAAGPTTDDRR